MKHFLREHWFKLSIALSIFSMAVSVVYTAFFYIPRHNTKITNDLFFKKIECNKIFSSLDKEFNNILTVSYDRGGNTCIVKYVDNGATGMVGIESFQRNR